MCSTNRGGKRDVTAGSGSRLASGAARHRRATRRARQFAAGSPAPLARVAPRSGLCADVKLLGCEQLQCFSTQARCEKREARRGSLEELLEGAAERSLEERPLVRVAYPNAVGDAAVRVDATHEEGRWRH